MTLSAPSEKVLVGITTYAGDFEQRLILRKALHHLRAKNGDRVWLVVISDGLIKDPVVHELADEILERPGPCGLHQGELDSIWQLVDFAKKNSFSRLIKSAGDIIMTEPDWARVVMTCFDKTRAKILSTHWFEDYSWVVGTKFFVADTDFLSETLPRTIERPNLEEAFTAEISKTNPLNQVAYLINSNTGERNEVVHELKQWGWEHAHRLSKFVCLDEHSTMLERCYGKWLLYPALRLKRDIARSVKKMGGQKMKAANPQSPKRILVVRRDNIGDLVCTTPAFSAIRKHFPEAEIGALVNSYNAEVLRANPNVDHVFVYQKLKHAGNLVGRFKALKQRLQLILQLRHWKADATILAKSSYDRHGLNFARHIGAKTIVGYVPDDLSQAKGLPDIQLRTPEFTTVHEVEAINGLLKPLGIENALGPLKVFPEVAAQRALEQSLPKAKRRIALHVSAREPERRWGTDRFSALARHILETEPETQVLLFWSPGKADDPHHPGDDEAAAQLLDEVRSDRLVPMATQNLTELIVALSLCELFIGTDGGAMHLAAALNKQVLALFENKSDKLNHWYPWQVPSRVVYGDRPEVAYILLEAVISALQSLQTELPGQH